MPYTKTVWTAEEGTLLNRFTKSNETTTSVELVRNPDSITVAGTPFNVSNMNNIEDAMELLYSCIEPSATDVQILKPMTITGTNGTLLSVGADSDIIVNLGKLKIDNRFSDHVVLSHYDLTGATQYGLVLKYDGNTYLNASGTGRTHIAHDNNYIATFSGTEISMLKPVTFSDDIKIASANYITTDSTAGTTALSGGNSVSNGGMIVLRGSTATNPNEIIIRQGNASRINIPNSGNVLINTTTDNGVDKLQVNGSIYAEDGFSTPNELGTIRLEGQTINIEYTNWAGVQGLLSFNNGILTDVL